MVDDCDKKSRNYIFYIFLFFTLLIYSNTFNSPWVLDDTQNIVGNPKIKINNFFPETIKNFFFEDNQGNKPPSRPVAMLSFAINWYFGGADVFGYHCVNILIHAIAGFFLFKIIVQLFSTPVLKKKEYHEKDIYNIALLTSVLWLIHPIHIQAITYIVQRMASMAAMFFLISIWAYINARFSHKMFFRVLFFSICLIFFLLAAGTKENALLLPFNLFLIEIVFFETFVNKQVGQKRFIILLIILIVFSTALFYKYIGFKLPSFETRVFNLTERLMTETRVLFKYLAQLFYPVHSQYSLAHDIKISKGLFSPLSTFISISSIFLILTLSVYYRKKFPVLCFSALFFFLNHSVESTLIPLELIFEHRNYLPSMFLFLPLGVAINYSLNFFFKKKFLFSVLLLSYSGIFFSVGISTYTINFDWQSKKTLWEDAISKAPNNSRSYHNLGRYYLQKGNYDKAEILYSKAEGLFSDTKNKNTLVSYNGLGSVYIGKKEFDKAILYRKKVIEIIPHFSPYLYRYVDSLVKASYLEKAYFFLNNEVKDNLWTPELLNIKTHVLLNLNKKEEALENAFSSFKLYKNNSESLCLLAFSYYENDEIDKAVNFLELAKKMQLPMEYKFYIYLCLLDNAIKTDNIALLHARLNEFLYFFNLHYIKKNLLKHNNSKYKLVNISSDEIYRRIKFFL